MDSNCIAFSIVVPVYNVEMYLKECVESILSQEYGNFELILVDDGSTDSSGQLCDSYKKLDARVNVIHKKNGGLVSARKAGIAVAGGKYAVCVDGDDFLEKEHLSVLKAIIDDCSPDVVCFNYFKVKGKEKTLCQNNLKCGLYRKDDIRTKIYPQLIMCGNGKNFPPAIWAKAYKLELYRNEQLAVDERIKIAEDAACTIPCIAKAESVYITNKPLYNYRIIPSSMTKSRSPFSLQGPLLVEQHLMRSLGSCAVCFQEQLSRRTVCSLLNVVKTQFYSSSPYADTVKTLRKYLQEPVCADAIKNSKFNLLSVAGIFRCFLKYKIFFPFYLASKIK